MPKPLLDGIVGARPNMMKMAALARAVEKDGTFRLRLIHTGQHYDKCMSGVFFEELKLPEPAFNLEVGPGTHGAQTARILEGYEGILLTGERPRGVLVVGDVNSTMACTLAAVKLGVPVAHVEAGLRSGDRTMPEEINRIVTDALSDLLFVSEPAGLKHLAREGRPREVIRFVGNIMMDTLFYELPYAAQSSLLRDLGLKPESYIYLTLHRPSNVDDPSVLKQLINLFQEISQEIPILFAVHPRTHARLEQFAISWTASERLRRVKPLGYRDNLQATRHARAVFTDSGGLQEEATVLGVPCLTLRDNTERPITVERGSSELVGNDPMRIREAWERVKEGRWKQSAPIPLWDGHTGERIVEHLRQAWA
ncbi:MAG TPA: UDP-N-acetylglucosamine 2-epimerase (non-hydrolyzing) [Chthonomonadales bacterium]|nr:UDP-N-acetylglucosamine 2-epimerase (non-hydrolyzing) [Chthonomonadales bacterium]